MVQSATNHQSLKNNIKTIGTGRTITLTFQNRNLKSTLSQIQNKTTLPNGSSNTKDKETIKTRRIEKVANHGKRKKTKEIIKDKTNLRELKTLRNSFSK